MDVALKVCGCLALLGVAWTGFVAGLWFLAKAIKEAG